MGGIKRKARYYSQRTFRLKNLSLGFLVLGLLASRPVAAPPRFDFAGLYRPAPGRLTLATRREGDSLRLLLNRPAPGPGQALPQLRLTVWPNYGAPQPLAQSTPALRLYPGSDPSSSLLVLTAALPATQLPADAVLQVQLLAPGAPTPSPTDNPVQNPTTTAWLRLSAERLARPFVLLDSTGSVLTRPYLRVGEQVAVVSFGLGQPVRWRRYATGAAALPPFADPRRQSAAPRMLSVLDSSAAPLPSGQLLRLPQPGLYALRVGGVGGEPLRTLSRYRRTPKGVTFGMNLIPRGTGTVRVGDAVTVLG